MKRTHWIWMVMAWLCLLGSTAVQAQTLSGTVTDPDGFSTGRVPGATITVNPGGYVAVSDGDGEFSITGVSAGTYTLSITHPDYDDYTMDLNMPDADKHIVLSLEGFGHIEPGSFNFKVIVTTPDGLSNTPVPGALVELVPGGYSGTTDDDGIVMFTLPAGNYQVTTSKSGYTNYTMDLTLDTDKQVVHSLEELIAASPAPVTYALSGIVTDPDGTSNTGIPGVLLTVEPGGYSATTDDGGHFGFPSLPEGTYTVTLSKPGYSGYAMDLRMNSDKYVVLSMSAGSMD